MALTIFFSIPVTNISLIASDSLGFGTKVFDGCVDKFGTEMSLHGDWRGTIYVPRR